MSSKGLTLISLLVYIALFALIAAMLARLVSGLLHANTQTQLAGEVLDNAQSTMALMAQEIQQAQGVYTPTSIFDTNPGQLSLVTAQNLPADETVTYLDFYLDDEHLYLKREGAAATLVTSDRVKLDNLVFTHLNPASAYPAIRISATFSADTPGSDTQAQTAITLTKTVALRAY
jgi:type II secretory pathway pseudopilin PulG